MKRKSYNHTLYKTFLREEGREDLFRETEHLSLGVLLAYTKIMDYIDEGTPLEMLNLHRINNGLDPIKRLSRASHKEITLIDNFDEIESTVDEADLYTIKEVFEKIDEYHKNREEEELGNI